MTFYVNPSCACALFRNNKQHVGREGVNAWKKADNIIMKYCPGGRNFALHQHVEESGR